MKRYAHGLGAFVAGCTILVSSVAPRAAASGVPANVGAQAPAHPMTPGGTVPPAEVGAPPLSSPLAPSLPIAGTSISSSVSAGRVLGYGDAGSYGSLNGSVLNKPIVGMAATPDGQGYWLVASDGGIFAFGDAGFHGSTGAMHLNKPIVGLAGTPDGQGYWLVASDGGIFAFGDAGFYGSTGAMHLNKPIVGMAATPDGRGYWLVASDGGIFAYGDAGFYGSTGSLSLNKPIVGMAATPDGRGYWLVASDGGIFAYGDAGFYGSTGAMHLDKPIVGMAAAPDGKGYWLAASDGGIFAYGDAGFYGSGAGQRLAQPVVAFAATPSGRGYWMAEGGPQQQNPLPAALLAELASRQGVVSASVLNLTDGTSYNYRPGQLGVTASIVKVEILGTLLSQAQAAHRPLTAQQRSLATSMIEFSNNSSATALWNQVGGAPAVAAFDRSVGMTSTMPATAWGLTTTTAADQVTLIAHLVEPNHVLSSNSRNSALGLMERVTPSQAWGVSAGTAPGSTVALKNGWLPVGNGWTVNSIGWIDGAGRNYVLAVLSAGEPSESYGITSIQMVARDAWSALGT